MLAMILFGVGEILGCFFIGFIVDKYGSKVAGVMNIIIMSLMTIVTVIYCVIWEFSWLAFVMCFLWGF
jgi:predicted MFS family arabinose efflux permease